MPYEDLREYLSALEKSKMLQWVDKEVDKDWEIGCISRLLFTAIPEEQRVAVGFSRIRGYDGMLFVAGILGASIRHVALAVEAKPDPFDILTKVRRGLANPIEPKIVNDGPCKEVVVKGDKIDLLKFPVIVWTPGKDPGPFLAPLWFTKDPESGDRNVGMYRSQIKGKSKTGIFFGHTQHGYLQIRKWHERGEAAPAAMVVGTDPSIYMTGVSKYQYGYDEIAGSGGVRGKAVELVRCETQDVEVPATAELVIEGVFRPGLAEAEGPFGEFTGYMAGSNSPMPIFEVTCITHRHNPIIQGVLSQMPPSESSMIRKTFLEASVMKHLRDDLKIPGILDYHMPESGGSCAIHWVRIKKTYFGQVEQVVGGITGYLHPAGYKWIVVCDEDVDIRNPFLREWVLSFRVRPTEDIKIVDRVPAAALDPSAGGPGGTYEWGRETLSSKVVIDATCKWVFPKRSIPDPDYLGKVKENWMAYGLPPLEQKLVEKL